jgi:nitric oxide synthase-interacting protein
LTPDVRDTKLGLAAQKTKEAPICPASSDDAPHAISMQKLITLRFEEDAAASSTDKRRMCPSCRKALTNATEPILAKRCGHVLCNKCVKQFLVPTGKQEKSEADSIISCFVCDEPVAVASAPETGSPSSLPTGLVALKSEGTGFSARGSNKVAKSGTAFQC